ncbi:MAG TPA: hypothetical protein VKE49_05585, partial [Myxococcaceae bacterium]|nr:hypothetical protein [Myxococcaceae bacterium]
GINVARAAVEHGVNLVDIGDEPLYVREVLTLHEEARARRCRLVIGSGTAPQTTGALLRLVLLRSGPGVDVCVGACFGINRVGPKAVRTALEAVSGLISLPEAPPVWQAKRTVNFGPPFHPLKLRTYPLPETVYVPAMPGVRSSSLGATLPEEWQNSTIGFLRRIGFARFSARTWLATPLTAFIAGVETRMARRGVAGSGIALYVEANRDGAPEVATLFHPDMTDLTAQALALTVGYLLGSTADPYFGVQLAHDVLEPQQFLDSLKPLGAQWELAGSAGERARVAHG